MRKSIITACLSLLFLVFYLIIVALLKIIVGTNFWIGYCFTILSIIALNLIVYFSDSRKMVSFPQSISMVTISVIYVITVFIINIKFGKAVIIDKKIVDLVKTNMFVLYQLIAFVLFIVLTIIIMANRNHLAEDNIKLEDELYERKKIIVELEALVIDTKKLEDSKEIKKNLENLIEKIKYSNIDNDSDVSDINENINKKVDRLKREIKNTIDINSIDYTPINDIINEVEELLVKKNSR